MRLSLYGYNGDLKRINAKEKLSSSFANEGTEFFKLYGSEDFTSEISNVDAGINSVFTN